jgi:hypothetical protein
MLTIYNGKRIHEEDLLYLWSPVIINVPLVDHSLRGVLVIIKLPSVDHAAFRGALTIRHHNFLDNTRSTRDASYIYFGLLD